MSSAPDAATGLLSGVRADGLLAPDRPVVVMLSGGRDSVCLLDVSVTVAGRAAVAVLHVNYGLRDAAAVEERHCIALCERFGVPLTVRRPARPPAGNLQAWAREVRYSAAAELARSRSADVATGHTATDQVETILYRLASSPSRRALLGMRPRNGSVIRPLLGFTREQTGAYCRQRDLRWCEDESNASVGFARSRVRAGLVPALREVHPAAEQNVLALAEILREESSVLDGLVDEVLGGGQDVALAHLRELPGAVRRLVVQRLADAAAGRPAPGAARRADELAGLPDRGRAALDLPWGVRATAQDGVLRFGLTPSDRGRRSGSRQAPAKPGARERAHKLDP